MKTLGQKLFSKIRLAATLPYNGMRKRAGREKTSVHTNLSLKKREIKFPSSWNCVDRKGECLPEQRTAHYEQIEWEIKNLKLCQQRMFGAREMYLMCVKKYLFRRNNNTSLHGPRWRLGPTDEQ